MIKTAVMTSIDPNLPRQPTFYYFRLPPFFIPMPPIVSPFFARTPSLVGCCPNSFWNTPPFDFVTLFVRAAFLSLFFDDMAPRSGSPILARRDAFFAERIATRIAPVSAASSSSAAIFLRLARLESPANLSRLGCGIGPLAATRSRWPHFTDLHFGCLLRLPLFASIETSLVLLFTQR